MTGTPPLRADLAATHRELLDHLAGPGCWLGGAERIALAAESRAAEHCPLCRERREALSPEHATGEHTRVSDLPEPLVELAHRVRSDPPRLSRRWFDGIRAAGVDEGTYVEAVGVVAIVAGLDFFRRALGEEPFALPEPQGGEPSRYRPEKALPGPGWVSTLAPEHATGPEADLYGGAPVVPHIRRALSLVPPTTRVLTSLMVSHYVGSEELLQVDRGRALDRMQMELVASRVSALNECFY